MKYDEITHDIKGDRIKKQTRCVEDVSMVMKKKWGLLYVNKIVIGKDKQREM